MPDFRGSVLRGERDIAAYSQDMSGMRIAPRCVAIPSDDQDIGPLFGYAEGAAIPITPRGAGSNQSGSAVGPGIIVPTTRMNRIEVSATGIVRVQAGAIHARVDDELASISRRLAYDPSSRTFCTIGGNVGTKASGLRGLKYGSVDRWVESVRFVCPGFGTVDTRNPSRELKGAIGELRDEARSDDTVSGFVKRRKGLKSSSGYNLDALFDHDEPGEIIAHLMCGSVGTLGFVTDVALRTIPLPERKMLLLAFPDSLRGAINAGLALRGFGPSALELVDEYGLAQMADAGIATPPDSKVLLMIEFDENAEALAARAADYLAGKGVEARRLNDAGSVSRAWKVREAMLLRIKRQMENGSTIVPPFVEDLAVPPDELPSFSAEVLGAMTKMGLKPVVYGHAGEGNLHFRLPIPKADGEALTTRLGDECVGIALSHGGTVTAEHGSGRLRLRYAEREFPRPVLELFDRTKDAFDPKG
ncbi:MAG TPA: FAD-binding oxidoreductase, partial [Methanomassiliicoccales archaeon]|nr:FAD-binding oxidoreductase [Methanomassiliicoccales archaeon]